MDVYGKALATIEDSDSENPNGGFTAILSTPSLDRDGDRLHRDEWIEPLPARLPLDIDHGMRVADTVGSFEPYFDDDKLMMRAVFASTPKAQEVRTLVKEGHISNVSVAFMTDKSKKDGQPRREILNAGIVSTPANRDAVILAAKAYSALRDAIPGVTADEAREIFDSEGEDTGDEKSLVKNLLDALTADKGAETKAPQGQSAGGGDNALLQAIHDASVHMGAVCVIPLQGDDDPTGTSDGANKGIVIGNKSVIGTLEDLQGRIGRALCSTFPNDYPYPRATYLNDDGKSGTVVYCLGDDLWAASFMDDGADVEVDDDNARPVGLITTLVDDPDEKSVKPADKEEKLEAFQKALDEVLTPQESPAESPADDAAAASDEEPAPADDAAEKAADDVAARVRAMELQLALLST